MASGPPPTLSVWYCSDILWYLQAPGRADGLQGTEVAACTPKTVHTYQRIQSALWIVRPNRHLNHNTYHRSGTLFKATNAHIDCNSQKAHRSPSCAFLTSSSLQSSWMPSTSYASIIAPGWRLGVWAQSYVVWKLLPMLQHHRQVVGMSTDPVIEKQIDWNHPRTSLKCHLMVSTCFNLSGKNCWN